MPENVAKVLSDEAEIHSMLDHPHIVKYIRVRFIMYSIAGIKGHCILLWSTYLEVDFVTTSR